MSRDIDDRNASEPLMLDRRAVWDEEPSAVAPTDFSPVRERPPQERPPGGDRPREPQDEGSEQNHEQSGERGKCLLRRHPIAFAIGLVLLIATLPIGYVYWSCREAWVELTGIRYDALQSDSTSRVAPAAARLMSFLRSVSTGSAATRREPTALCSVSPPTVGDPYASAN